MTLRLQFVLYLLFLMVCCWTNQGWVHPDEHARVLEAAHYIVYGYATLPWELRGPHPMVSFMLGAFHAPLLLVTQYFGLSGLSEAAILRMFSALVASTQVWAFWMLLHLLRLHETRRRLYLFLFMFSPFIPLLLIRTSQENWSATFFLWALVLFLKLKAAVKSDRVAGRRIFEALGLGFCLALAGTSRFQMGFPVAALGLIALVRLDRRLILLVCLGGLIGLVPMALVDYAYTGRPFLPAWNYLTYALGNEEGGELWGSSPWYFYLIAFFGYWYPPLSLICAIFLPLGLWLRPVLGIPFVAFAVPHFILGHKEARYFTPMIPLMLLACFAACDCVYDRYSTSLSDLFARKWAKVLVSAALFLSIMVSVVLGLAPENTAPAFFDELRKIEETNSAVGRDNLIYVADSRSHVALFYYKHPEALPRRMEQRDFLLLFKDHDAEYAGRFYAIYRTDSDTLRRIEKQCPASYMSISPLYRRVLDFLFDRPGQKRLDAIVAC